MRRTLPAAWFFTLVAVAAFLTAPVWAKAGAPDYSQARHWLYLPEKTGKPADVFWVYPTVYNGDALVADIDDPQMRKDAAGTLAAQAGVFADKANIFAPLYRQANISVLGMSPEQKDKHLAVGRGDVFSAFEYYLKKLNKGRPFIMAGHSQGSDHLTSLLLANAKNPALVNMVAAYLIGWSVTEDDLEKHPSLKMCQNAHQTRCIVSYNCVAKGFQKKAPTILPGAVSVNPLTWSTGGGPAPASKNLGAVFFTESGGKIEIKHFTSAQNKEGGLEVAPKDPSLTPDMCFGPGVYHVYDYSLFFRNLQQNAAQRIEAFGR